MKKLCCIVSAALLACLLCACGTKSGEPTSVRTSENSSAVEDTTDMANPLDAVDVLYEEGEHYKIYSNAEKTLYRYDVLDNTGALIDQGYQDWHCVSFKETGNILQLFYWYSGPLSLVRYYDTENGRVSRFFSSPLLTYEETVAYFSVREDSIILVVQNMFEPATFYREFDRDFSKTAVPADALTSAAFTDENTLQVTYLSGGDFETVEETIRLQESF